MIFYSLMKRKGSEKTPKCFKFYTGSERMISCLIYDVYAVKMSILN